MEKLRVAFILTRAISNMYVSFSRSYDWDLCLNRHNQVIIDMPDDAVNLPDEKRRDFLYDYWDKHKEQLIKEYIEPQYPGMVPRWQEVW